MIWVLGIIGLFYLLLIFYLLFGFGKLPVSRTMGTEIVNSFSIVIPFRNEGRNLKMLFSSLKSLEYPREAYEILLVNDDSEDDSEALCREFIQENPELQVKLLNSVRVSASPKKDAILVAISESQFEYILTTDADCTVPVGWLGAYNSFIEEMGAELIAGPVVLKKEPGFLNRFQELDVLSLQAATMGAFGVEKPIMCNGANLCYRKAGFLEVEGFRGNGNIASGDDIFLLGKFVVRNKKTGFLKNPEATVTTCAQPDLRSLFSQRIRWAAKTSSYEDAFAKLVGIAVLLMNLVLVVELALLLFGFDVKQILLLSFLFKFNADFLLLYRGAHFFGREKSMKSYFWASLLYPFFCTSIGIFSLFSGYNWKGRRFGK